MEIIKNVMKWGNSGGILLPREWMGSQVKVILINRTLEIKKEVISILEPYFEDILGIYLVGSYARNEQEEDSDIDIVVISNKIKKQIKSGKYDISISTLEGIKKTLEKNPILILPRLNEAKVILNSHLLEELKNTKIQKNSFKEFIEESKRIIKINKGFIKLDKEQEFEYLDSTNILYSLILRLRGIFLISKLLKKEKYSKKEFLKLLKEKIGKEELEKVYDIYKAIRDDKKPKQKIKIKIETAEKLIELLEKEIQGLK